METVPVHWGLVLWEAGCGLDSASKLYPMVENHNETEEEMLSR